METNDFEKVDLGKIKNIKNVELTESECEAIDKWYREHPSCTHAAYVSTLESIRGMNIDGESDRMSSFLKSLSKKVLSIRRGICLTYYVFDDAAENAHCITCDTISFDVVNDKVTSCRTGKNIVGEDNYVQFMNMKEVDYDEIHEMFVKLSKTIKGIIFKQL